MIINNIIDSIAKIPIKPIKFKWDKTKRIPRNVKRKIRRMYNKLNIEDKIHKVYMELMIYGDN